MYTDRVKRKKAFLGSLIGGVLGVAGSAIGGAINRKYQKRQLRKQQIAQNRQDTYEMANNLSAAYGNQDYVDDFQNKVIFKAGGETKYKDRIKVAKKYKCGGRKKFETGGETKVIENKTPIKENNNSWTSDATSGTINGLSSIGSNIIGALFNKPVGEVKSVNSFTSTPKESIDAPDYTIDLLKNRIALKAGGRYKKRK